MCTTGPIAEEEPFRVEEGATNEHCLSCANLLQEVLSLLELEAEPTNSDAAAAGFCHALRGVGRSCESVRQGWIPIGSPELSVEYWRDMPGLRALSLMPGEGMNQASI